MQQQPDGPAEWLALYTSGCSRDCHAMWLCAYRLSPGGKVDRDCLKNVALDSDTVGSATTGRATALTPEGRAS